MKIVFISDLHLSPLTLDNNQLFFSIMTKWVGKIDALYILGDFFDYWIGDDDRNSFFDKIKFYFREFTKTTPIFFIGGNHDFAVGHQFEKETNITILKDRHILKVNDKKFLLTHGDIFCTLDTSYQKLKKILQNPLTIFILKKLPLSWRRAIKNKLEKTTHNSYKPHKNHIYKVVDDTVVKYAKKHKVNFIIHGHTHNPGHYTLKLVHGQDITRIELPDWVDQRSGGYLLLENDKFTLYKNLNEVVNIQL